MPRRITARCQACGMEIEIEWSRGTKCPSCGSDKFFPVVRIDSPGGRPSGAKLSRRPLGLALAILLFAFAVFALIYQVHRTSRPKEFYRMTTLVCTNRDCGHIFRARLITSEVYPKTRCPRCKLVTALRAVQCRVCGEIFPLDPDRQPDPTTDLRCPNCGSQEINFDSSTLELEEEEAL